MTKKRNGVIAVIVCAALALLIAILCLTGVIGGNAMHIKGLMGGSLTVGKDIDNADITDFYYTYDASTNPPAFQRYRFYTENGKYYFYNETREGDHWPLTEADATVKVTKELTAQEWAQFLDCIQGGTVKKRTESTESGSAGPWLFLYWKGDGGKVQEYTFASYDKQTAFEALCEKLNNN